MADTQEHEHSKPNYRGCCDSCGARLVSPSQQLRDYADRIGGEIVSMTKTFTLRPDQPCGHPGCLHHVSHPCDGCGRIAGRATTEPTDG